MNHRSPGPRHRVHHSMHSLSSQNSSWLAESFALLYTKSFCFQISWVVCLVFSPGHGIFAKTPSILPTSVCFLYPLSSNSPEILSKNSLTSLLLSLGVSFISLPVLSECFVILWIHSISGIKSICIDKLLPKTRLDHNRQQIVESYKKVIWNDGFLYFCTTWLRPTIGDSLELPWVNTVLCSKSCLWAK